MTILTLASSSSIRAKLLRNAGLDFEVKPARIDEASITESLRSEGATPHDIADALAEHKALRTANRDPTALVLGCDQLLECEGQLYQKPETPEDALRQLSELRGKTHRLHTAAVLFAQRQPVWRHVSTPRLTMRTCSDGFLERYVADNWDNIRHCVGCYQIEGPGIRLFSRIEGDLFAIQGLPLLELLSILIQRKDIPG
ncbi:nucleoside triphosphate pyrophosphatase [Pararhodobacter sp.]|uniref:Maf family protein n=1 Tax=Pararhodobacter sp. TaxID=2127056 RepID=UPI002AFEF42B|nr:nucleoside triphosphate pyrophosphatase [Pararhodobacter sp.]